MQFLAPVMNVMTFTLWHGIRGFLLYISMHFLSYIFYAFPVLYLSIFQFVYISVLYLSIFQLTGKLNKVRRKKTKQINKQKPPHTKIQKAFFFLRCY